MTPGQTGNDAAAHRWDRDRVFSAAWAYDLAFAWDVGPELDVVLALAGFAGAARGRLVVPACGTGRHAVALAERGFHVEASDVNPAMLARARAVRSHPRVTYALADMTRRLGTGAADRDAAFTFCNSFRYILDADGVAGHLRAVRDRLRPAAIYVLELVLNHRAAAIGRRVRWIARHADCEAHACWTLRSVSPPISIELAEIRVIGRDGVVHEFVDEQPQRLWTRAELEVCAAAAGLEVAAVVDLGGQPITALEEPVRVYAALARRPA